jgi:hypothetical protein
VALNWPRHWLCSVLHDGFDLKLPGIGRGSPSALDFVQGVNRNLVTTGSHKKLGAPLGFVLVASVALNPLTQWLRWSPCDGLVLVPELASIRGERHDAPSIESGVVVRRRKGFERMGMARSPAGSASRRHPGQPPLSIMFSRNGLARTHFVSNSAFLRRVGLALPFRFAEPSRQGKPYPTGSPRTFPSQLGSGIGPSTGGLASRSGARKPPPRRGWPAACWPGSSRAGRSGVTRGAVGNRR